MPPGDDDFRCMYCDKPLPCENTTEHQRYARLAEEGQLDEDEGLCSHCDEPIPCPGLCTDEEIQAWNDSFRTEPPFPATDAPMLISYDPQHGRVEFRVEPMPGNPGRFTLAGYAVDYLPVPALPVITESPSRCPACDGPEPCLCLVLAALREDPTPASEIGMAAIKQEQQQEQQQKQQQRKTRLELIKI